MRIILLLCSMAGLPGHIFSQAGGITISGYVEDAKTGERLIGATIYSPNHENGTVTNSYGFYSLDIPKGAEVAIIVSFVGYTSLYKQIKGDKSQTANFILTPGSQLEEAIVVGSREKPIERRTEMGVIRIPIKDIERLPALGGEADIIKALQLMPGVQSGSEGSSNLFVRGGSPDQNLMLLDDVPLYYVNHLGGFVSTFNTDAIKDVKLIKGGFPAHYGSRLSSVVDIRMKDGNINEFHGSGMLGLIASKISVEGPIKKDTTSYIISARRMLLDVVMFPLSKLFFDGFGIGYHFYDFNAKINHRLTKRDQLFFSTYFGKDVLGFNAILKEQYGKYKFKAHFKWGNTLLALRWNHIYNHKLFSNLTLSYTKYHYLTDVSDDFRSGNSKDYSYRSFVSGVYDFGIKADFEYFINAQNKLAFGASTTYHTFIPGISTFIQENETGVLRNKVFGQNRSTIGIEHAIYVEDEWQIGQWVKANIGFRFNDYNIRKKHFPSLEPRVLINVLATENLSIKASYSKMQQNIHLLTNAGANLPIDLWMPATDKAVPENSVQWTIGAAKSIKNGVYELSVEAYYKTMKNLITYKPGASILGTSVVDWERKVEKNGDGRSYGIEFLLQKKSGRSTGWVAYTLSKTDRQFLNVNVGKRYPFKYDRRHDLSLVFIHHLNDKIDFSATWVYGTGNAITLAIGHYNAIDRKESPNYPGYWHNGEDTYSDTYIYNGKNTYRMRPYHRLDIGINLHKKKKWGARIWNFSIYNVYNRQNPYFYFFEDTVERDAHGNDIPGTQQTKLKQQSLFPIIPSASYSFKF